MHCAATAELAETFLASQTVDLVMLDIRLPGKDGLTLTRELRVRSEVGIILITGRNDEIDRIVGLECGADDYVIKPLNPRELVSRAKNLIRRVRHAQTPQPAAAIAKPVKQFADLGAGHRPPTADRPGRQRNPADPRRIPVAQRVPAQQRPHLEPRSTDGPDPQPRMGAQRPLHRRAGRTLAPQVARRPGRAAIDHYHSRRRLPVYRQRGGLSPMLRVLGLLLALAANSAMAAETVRYCDYPVYPPISWSDGKHVRGLAPSVVKNLFGRLGYDVDIVVLGNWKRCLLDAAEGRVDVVLAYSTAQREQSMVFSTVPVLREEVALFINRQHPVKFERLEDLAHYRGGLLFGESYGVDFDRLVAQHQNIEWVSDSRPELRQTDSRAHRFHHLGTAHRAALRREPAGRARHRRAAQCLERGLFAGGCLAQVALANRMPEIDAQLKRMVDTGEVERLLNESEVTYRDMINLPANSK